MKKPFRIFQLSVEVRMAINLQQLYFKIRPRHIAAKTNWHKAYHRWAIRQPPKYYISNDFCKKRTKPCAEIEIILKKSPAK